MCQNSAVYSLHNQTGTKWPVSGLDLGIRFVEKLCDSDVDTHIIDVHPQKYICTIYYSYAHTCDTTSQLSWQSPTIMG